MAIIRIQPPNTINSFWTHEKVVKTVRSALDELDNEKINNIEIRHFMNMAISNAVYSATENVNGDYYGVILLGLLDQTSIIPYISFTRPLTNYVPTADPDSISSTRYVPNYPENYFTTPQDATTLANQAFLSGANILNQQVPLYTDPSLGQITQRQWYETYFLPSAIIYKILDVAAIHPAAVNPPLSLAPTALPANFYSPLMKLSMTEISYLASRNDNTLKQSGGWTYFGGRLYIHLGSDLRAVTFLAGDPEVPIPDQYLLAFQIAALRKPILDNLIDEYDANTSYYSHVDVPDSLMKTVVLATQKMCLDKLGKRLSPDQEGILNQLLGAIGGQDNINMQTLQAQRNKVEQGFQTR